MGVFGKGEGEEKFESDFCRIPQSSGGNPDCPVWGEKTSVTKVASVEPALDGT